MTSDFSQDRRTVNRGAAGRINRTDAIAAAREEARRAVHTLALNAGAKIASRPLFAGADVTIRDVDLVAGLRASRELELGARDMARSYLRQAREAGYSWHDIGVAMNLVVGREPDQAGQTVAEAAFSYAAGDPDNEHARRYGRSFSWTCTSCDRAISDHGLDNGPADDERGHTRDCRRHAETIAAWEAEWEAGE